MSDPSLCTEGITFALWAQVRQPANSSDSSYAFLFSTGGQSSRGCALYRRGADRLRATVSDGALEWTVEIEFEPHPGTKLNLIYLSISAL